MIPRLIVSLMSPLSSLSKLFDIYGNILVRLARRDLTYFACQLPCG